MSGEIRSRLQRLRSTGELHGSSSAKPPQPVLRRAFLFPGEERIEETAAGSCYLRELRFPLHKYHGNTPLGKLLDCRGSALALPAKDQSLTALNPSRSLFLDIETTGLSGGTGTWIFLIGLGWVAQDEFILRQYFLRHPREEKAMLAHFTGLMEKYTDVVTFNGRVFDLPLIATRQILTGLIPTKPERHLDLLPCSRRLWKERLGSCSLRFLEENLLGFQRHDDIPGWEIPSVYFNYLRRGETARLRSVFHHNVLDILSMAALLTRVAETAAEKELEYPADYYSLGKLYSEAGETESAIRCLGRIISCGDRELEHTALLQLSLIYKRLQRWTEAAALWRELLERQTHDLTAYIELAKYYEHKTGEYEKAFALTSQALQRTRRRNFAPAAGELSLPALQHRLSRLQRKLKVSQGE